MQFSFSFHPASSKMLCSKLLFLSFLLAGYNLPESLCVRRSRTEQTSERQYDYRTDEMRPRTPETKPADEYEDEGPLLFPVDVFGMSENSQELGTSEQRNDARTTNRPPSSEGAKQFGRPNSFGTRWSSGKSPSLSRSNNSKPQYSKQSDPTPLMECMLNVVKLTLPPVILGEVDPVQNFLGMLDELSGEESTAHPVAIAISPDTLESFVDVATSCLEMLKHDRNGRLVLEEGFATSGAAEATKQHPMGLLALRATEAIVENVSVTYDKKKKRQYNTNYTGLAYGLGMAAVKTTKIGQIAMKSTEGRNWLSRSVGRNIEGGGRRNHPIDQVALLECTLNAAIGLLSVIDSGDQGLSLVSNQADSNVSALESFVTGVKPCLGLFKRHGNGRLGLGEDIIAEAIKLDPMGMLAMGSADAVAASVTGTPDGDGNIQYYINYADLANGLGNALVESAKVAQPESVPAENLRRPSRGFSRLFWGPDPSCEPTALSLATALKCVRTCVAKTLGGVWLTRSIKQILKGLGPRKRIPTNLAQLLGCVSKAVVTSLFGGVIRLKPKRAAKKPVGGPETSITPNVLESFVKKVTPCFAFFKRNEYGMLEIDPNFIRGTAAEALRLLPVGALVVGTIETIAKNVKEVRDKEGNLQYKINYPGLTAGLGAVIADATTFGIVGTVTDVVRSFL